MIAAMPDLELPSTPAEAYDLLQRMFGVGSYDDLVSPEPWFKARGMEIAKLKRMMTRRKVSPEQLGKAAWWAKREGIGLAWSSALLPHLGPAARAWREAERAEARERTLMEVGDVIEEAAAAGDEEFVGRLLRADPDGTVALVAEWRARR